MRTYLPVLLITDSKFSEKVFSEFKFSKRNKNKATKILFSAAGSFILVGNSSLWEANTGKTQEDISPEAAGGDE